MKPLPLLAEIERLLIVKTSSLGDVIHALPVAQALQAARPGLTLGWVVRRRCADILRSNPAIDRLYVMENRPKLGELRRLRRTLRAEDYQMALDMQGLLLSGLITGLSGAPVRVGWDRNREANALFLTHPIVPGRLSQVGVRHEVDLLCGFARALGVNTELDEFPPQPYLAAEGRDKAEDWLCGLRRPCLALNIGAARAYKRWPAEHWVELGRALAERRCGLVFVGDESDAALAAGIKAQLPPATNVVDVAGRTTLRELAAVLAECDLVISGDTGPMHLAVAVGTPVVALFGATDPRRHGPYGRRNTVLSDAASVTAGRPMEAEGTAAMRAIAPATVLAAAQARLHDRGPAIEAAGG
ncbi:MAG: glycosyltransferase family 9 protein [Armatimonadetes bacterium]|nr:glycosyltransferase family 9 protein [Armatimonadota bacterium]